MSWKTLVIIATLTAGTLAGKYEMKGQKKVRLQQSLDNACQGLPETEREQVLGLAMGAIECISECLDETTVGISAQNATQGEEFLEFIRQFCVIRERLRTCGQQLLEYLAPCSSEAVQAQIGDMKKAVTELFGLFCDDDMANTKHFVSAGAFECGEKYSDRFNNCTGHMFELVTDVPADTQSFEAIEMCNSYDQMASCVLGIAGECPDAYVKEFTENVLTLFRSGTYCKVSVPVGNEVDSSNIPE